jgi:hypothetical protein
VYQVVEKEDIYFLIFDNTIQRFKYINACECIPIDASIQSVPQTNYVTPGSTDQGLIDPETQKKIQAYTDTYSEWINGDGKEQT